MSLSSSSSESSSGSNDSSEGGDDTENSDDDKKHDKSKKRKSVKGKKKRTFHSSDSSSGSSAPDSMCSSGTLGEKAGRLVIRVKRKLKRKDIGEENLKSLHAEINLMMKLLRRSSERE